MRSPIRGGDSVTSAELVAACPRALRLDKSCVDQFAPHYVMLEKVFRAAGSFDLIHFHIDYLHFPLSSRASFPQVTTLHGRLDIPELPALYDAFPDMPVISISDSQRRPLPRANWQATVYHGLPANPNGFRSHTGNTSRSSAASRLRSAWTARSRLPAAWA